MQCARASPLHNVDHTNIQCYCDFTSDTGSALRAVVMAKAMTVSRKAYQNIHPPPIPFHYDINNPWLPAGSLHVTSNGVNVGAQAASNSLHTTNRTTAALVVAPTMPFYQTGQPTEYPAPKTSLSTKRKRKHSIDAAADVRAGIKKTRKPWSIENAQSYTDIAQSSSSKSHSVTGFIDELGIWRAREVMVSKVEDVSIPCPQVWKEDIVKRFHITRPFPLEPC